MLPRRGILVPSETDRKDFFSDRKLNKVERANNAVPHLANRKIILNELMANKEELVAEALAFPKGKHDDFVDTLIDLIKYVYGRSHSMFDVL
jgi:predicted phage terminase large subunit-like protein